MIPVRILGTAGVLPGRAVPTEELARQLGRDPVKLEANTGIRTRYWVEPGTRMRDVGLQALRSALEAAKLAPTDLRRILFVSSTGGDSSAPATASMIAGALGLTYTCDAFDLNNACAGFVSAFDVAARSVATGLGPVGIVTVEFCSRALEPGNPRPYLVMGDAAAATVLGAARPNEGVLGVSLSNNGTLPPDTGLGQPLFTGKRETIQFYAPRGYIFQVAVDALGSATQAALQQANLTLEDIQWVLPHQPNGPLVDAIVTSLGIDRAKLIPIVQDVGSVAAASIPYSLDVLMRTREVRPGDRILLLGLGAGVAQGAIIYQVGG
ncbi:3-oxoacyl-ACP synthase III family protein [Hyalangium versicolor]|uniref:3-oxoacyl-ACP synthase III family protein n=1 Tax=Hyalangium versicolor TaxID=2861190 RepID=UPI001CCC4CB7|nr:3-oxoacyl-[acyl-carrier-protein] synthase III C-terminal domain-containing protein [Hyalangium versicolor]